MSFTTRSLATAVVALLLSSNVSAEDCEIAKRYYTLASTALEEYREEDAYELLQRATESCDAYTYWVEYAELGTRFGDEERTATSAAAFVTARELSSTEAEEARAIAGYAEILYHSGDRSRATDYVFQARNLDPDNEEILELAERMQSETAVLTEQDIKRGRASVLFEPMPPRKTASAPPATPANIPAQEQGSGGAGRTTEVVQTSSKVNVPLTFEYGTTELDPQSRSNVDTLAKTLATFEAEQNFIFEGHADARGDANYNRDLSLRRAVAVKDLVVAMEPALDGRIIVVGKGEDDLKSRGDRESDHRANRRLEVKFR